MPTIKKECYDKYRKEVCDEKGNHKPNHSLATVLCILEEILDEIKALKECKCCKCKSGSSKCETSIDSTEQTATATSDVDQTGLVNVNVGETVAAAKKKGK